MCVFNLGGGDEFPVIILDLVCRFRWGPAAAGMVAGSRKGERWGAHKGTRTLLSDQLLERWRELASHPEHFRGLSLSVGLLEDHGGLWLFHFIIVECLSC